VLPVLELGGFSSSLKAITRLAAGCYASKEEGKELTRSSLYLSEMDRCEFVPDPLYIYTFIRDIRASAHLAV
jgi:hypothetical protein